MKSICLMVLTALVLSGCSATTTRQANLKRSFQVNASMLGVGY
jgi:hypothetical protein